MLSLQKLFMSLCDREPLRTVNLRKRLELPASWRPLHLELVALQLCSWKVTFHREGGDEFSSFLTNLTERNEGPSQRPARLLGEFTPGGRFGQFLF